MDREILEEFLAESWENLARLDTEIVQLERFPQDDELISSIFRTIHTIKGTCGFLGLTRLGAVAHSTEDVLGRLRDGRLEVSPPAISLILAGIDRIKELLSGLEETQQEPELDSRELIHRLDLLASLGAPVPGSRDKLSEPLARPETNLVAPLGAALSGAIAIGSSKLTSGGINSDSNCLPSADRACVSPKGRAIEDSESAATDSRKTVSDLSIRVSVDVLDLLMNLVGELVLTRNQLLQLVRDEEDSHYSVPIALLNRVTTDLQEGVMKTRMQPIKNAWSKLPRLVRDLCEVTGKQVHLEMLGSETELDRTVLDAIRDPLTHMVRNSIDHGIEVPSVRRLAGKPEQGLLQLRAFQEGGHVILCINDDGRGIDRQQILRKALELGIVTDVEAAGLTETEIDCLIFRAGFSTAAQVTAVSGRGVGMDVVRTEIERIGGTIELSSIPGKGTTIRIKIPLTLAIISALVVESGGIHFAIPLLGVVELVRVPSEHRHRVERIRDQQVFRLRDRLLPLIELSAILQLSHSDVVDEDDLYIVVVQVGEEQLGLIVSEVFDTQEIVVKPVGRLLKDVAIYQGTTILGDGRVIMILDIAGIAGRLGQNRVEQLHPASDQTNHGEADEAIEPTTLLVFRTPFGQTQAVPLSLVSRLEEFPKTAIEFSGERMLVQYRGQLLPLVPLAGTGNEQLLREIQPVIVFSDERDALGLLVDQIHDIIEAPLQIRKDTCRPGILGTAIVDGKSTDVVDTQHYISQASSNWFKSRFERPPRVLVVIESPFFRQLVRTVCDAAGFGTSVVESLSRAEEFLDRGGQCDAIICDADTTNNELLSFQTWTRRGLQNGERVVVALSGIESPDPQTSLLACGCDVVLPKFDAQLLTDTLNVRLRSKRPLPGAST